MACAGRSRTPSFVSRVGGRGKGRREKKASERASERARERENEQRKGKVREERAVSSLARIHRRHYATANLRQTAPSNVDGAVGNTTCSPRKCPSGKRAHKSYRCPMLPSFARLASGGARTHLFTAPAPPRQRKVVSVASNGARPKSGARSHRRQRWRRTKGTYVRNDSLLVTLFGGRTPSSCVVAVVEGGAAQGRRYACRGRDVGQ